MSDILPCYLIFSYAPGIGPTHFDLLLKHFGSVEAAYHASRQDLEKVCSVRFTEKYLAFRSKFDLDAELKHIADSHITVLTREDPRFPPQLLEISDPPICLYVKGDSEQFDWKQDFFFAIVGTRQPTEYGSRIATRFSEELAHAGAVIVSGMAMGIDALAHQGALAVGARTIAFLGCGVNIVYPAINRPLYYDIIKNGIVCSEFPPDMRTEKGLFVARNRLISGLSKGVLVAEGLKDSGSLITARCALEQGKDVFAPPAPITVKQSEAPNLLLKEGAKMVTDVNDILDEYGLKQKKQRADISQRLPSEQKELFTLLSEHSFTADDLARTLKVPIFRVLPLLSTMELDGIIEKNGAGKYQVRG